MGFVISHLWHLIGQDAESTSYNVARKFLDDPEQPSDVMTRRAEALRTISHIFAVRSGARAACMRSWVMCTKARRVATRPPAWAEPCLHPLAAATVALLASG